MRTRVKGQIVEFLKENSPATTSQVYEYINERSVYGVTMNQLANLLARTPTIEKVGYVDIRQPLDTEIGRFTERVRQCFWAIQEK